MIAPRRPGAQIPEDAVEHLPRIAELAAGHGRACGQEQLDQFPVSRALFADDDRLGHAAVRFWARGFEALGADDAADVVRAEEVIGDFAHVGRPGRGKHADKFVG